MMNTVAKAKRRVVFDNVTGSLGFKCTLSITTRAQDYLFRTMVYAKQQPCTKQVAILERNNNGPVTQES